MKWVGEILRELRDLDASMSGIVLLIWGYAIIRYGSPWFQTILTHRREMYRVKREVGMKQERARLEFRDKMAKIEEREEKLKSRRVKVERQP